MNRFVFVMFVLFSQDVFAAQPKNIKLDPNGISYIYPVLDSKDWIMTQPEYSKAYDYHDTGRVTHWGDDYFAQDWARGCGTTAGLRLYAGISGKAVWAGDRGPYGNTVTIYDEDNKFALKYSHLSEVAVTTGEYVLAGKSFVGRVGNTGNVSGSCSSDPGAHLHLSLYKNVSDPSARPVSTTVASNGTAATQFAAPFGYVAEVDLQKAVGDAAVFVLDHGTNFFVSAASFESHGWDFDRYRLMFDPLKGREFSVSAVYAAPQAVDYFPFRDTTLIKSDSGQAVFQFIDGQKKILSSIIFSCRALRFNEVVSVTGWEKDAYSPDRDSESRGCANPTKQSLTDLSSFAKKSGFVSPDLSKYFYYPDWDPAWELRYVSFKLLQGGKTITIYWAGHVLEPNVRYLGYFDPATTQWAGWQRAQ